jgi:2'-5' RNA ligase
MTRIQSGLTIVARPVRPANFHITLVFLGNIAISRVAELLEIAGTLKFPDFVIRLDTLGSFRKSGVEWLGCSEVPGSLVAFQASLSARLEAAGFSSDIRSWKPHVTLYRDLRTAPATMEFEALNWKPERFCLMQSGQDRNGVFYQRLGQWPDRN